MSLRFHFLAMIFVTLTIGGMPNLEAKSISSPAVETSIRNLAITPFTVQKNLAAEITAEQTLRMAKQIAAELNAKSFLTAGVLGSGGLSRKSRDLLVEEMNKDSFDGAVIGEINSLGASLYIVTKNGVRVASSSLQKKLGAIDAQTLKELGTAIVDEIVRSVPYRGFLTKDLGAGKFELNLGSTHGLAKDQRLRVFDYEEANLASTKIDRGEIKVLEVAPTTSTVEVVSDSRQVRAFQKVGFDERARGMVQLVQAPTRGFALIGAELLSVSGTSDPRYADKSYTLKATPGLALGLGWKKTSLRVLLAQAQSSEADLVYTEVIGLYRFWERTSGFNRFHASAGGRFARFGVTASKNVVSALETSTSLSPALAGRMERMIGGPVHAFLGGDVFYPMFNSGNGASSSPMFAYGVGGQLGAIVDFSPRISMEFGGKLNVIRRPMAEQNSVIERYSQIFADVVARF